MISNPLLRAVFGAFGQIVVGVIFFLATIAQSAFWLGFSTPDATAIFIVSMEALAFAAYAIIATGLAYLATEAVAEKQAEDADVQEVLDEVKKNN